MLKSTLGLAQRLKAETAAEHERTENRMFMTSLINGKLDLAAYGIYLAQYALVYQALESRPQFAADPQFIHDPALWRSAAITADLTGLAARDQGPLAATEQYVDRLGEVAADEDPARFIAHHYVRYMGDMSGGQAIGTMLARHYGATAEQLSFFRFDQIPNLVRYKRAYRQHLDELGLSGDHEDLIIAEAQAAFLYNDAIFVELQGLCGLREEPVEG